MPVIRKAIGKKDIVGRGEEVTVLTVAMPIPYK